MAGWTCPDRETIFWDGTIEARKIFRSPKADIRELEPNVGIGTDSPSQDLHVKDATDNAAILVESDKVNGVARIMLLNDGAQWDLRTSSTDEFQLVDGGNSKIPFKVAVNSPTNSLVVDSDGEVGIGTSAPDMNLHIRDANAELHLDSTGGAGFARITFDAQTPTTSVTAGYYDDTYSVSEYQSKFVIQTRDHPIVLAAYGTTANDQIQFYTGGRTSSERRMVIDKDGNVGIGEISPSQRLQVSGSILASGADLASGALYASGALFTGGRVGIGTVSPAYSLDVVGAIRVANNSFFTDGLAVNISNPAGADAGNLDVWTNQRWRTAAGASVGFFDVDNIRLGIGTTSPTADLSVQERVGMDASGAFMVKLTNNSGGRLSSGAIVEASTANDMSASLAVVDSNVPIGAALDDIANGASGWIQTGGIVKVRMDINGCSKGDWVKTSSNTAGYAESLGTQQPGVNHFREIGHALEDGASGALVRIMMHFN